MRDKVNALADRITEVERSLRGRFGDLIGLKDLTGLLRFPSTGAIRKARLRGRLPVAVAQFPNRRGWYTTPREVAEVLALFEASIGEVNHEQGMAIAMAEEVRDVAGQ